MFGGLTKGGRQPIGLDIGEHAVRALQLTPRGDGWAVTGAAWRDRPPDDQGHERPGRLAETVAAVVEEGGFRGRRVVSTLPTGLVQCKNLRLPPMPPNELRAAVEWEAADRLKLGSVYKIQFYDAGQVRQGDETRQEVILLAAPMKQIEAHVAMLQACGLEPVAIDAAPSALARAVNRRASADDETGFVVDVGYSASKVLISRAGRVMFFKSIALGVKSFDEAIAETLGLGSGDAAEVRRKLSGAEGAPFAPGNEQGGGQHRAVADAVRPVATELAREVALCLRYYSVTFRGYRPESIALCGGGAHEPTLRDALRQEANLQVVTRDAFSHIDFAGVDAGRIGGSPVTWGVAAGLSMRRSMGRGRRAA